MNRLGLPLLLVLAGCAAHVAAPRPAAGPAEPVHIVIVGTTDVHGAFAGRSDTVKGGPTVKSGGLPLLSSYLEALREANGGRVVLVDSGDMFQGTLESNLFEGEPVVRAYNRLGYAAAAVGNHEFDYGPVGPDSVVTQPGQDSLGALKKNASSAAFPLLSANMVETATGQTPAWAKRSTIVTTGGVKIGIIGLSTPDTPNVTMASNVKSLTFTDPVKAAIDEAALLRGEGVDAVVVIAHMGGRCSDLDDVHDVGSCETNQEAMRFLAAIPAGTIDGYFAGHTHQQMRQFVNSVPAAQASAFSQAFSTLDLWIDPASHRVLPQRSAIRPHTPLCTVVWSGTTSCDTRRPPAGATLVPRAFEGKTMEPDAQMAALIEPYLEKTAAKKNEPTGIRTAARFGRQYRQESVLGDLLADALRGATGADAAFINSGSIRTDLREGELVYNDIFEVSPFDNYAVVVTMTGAQIREALNVVVSTDRGILQTSGLQYSFDDRLAPGQRVTSVSLPAGQPIDPAATYRVAMPDFLATGGEGLQPVLSQIPREGFSFDQSRPMRDLFAATLAKWPQPIAPKPLGRITAAAPKAGE